MTAAAIFASVCGCLRVFEPELETKAGLWSKGPCGWILSLWRSISGEVSPKAGWPIFSYPGVIKNLLHLNYARLLELDIITGMHYNSRLLQARCVPERLSNHRDVGSRLESSNWKHCGFRFLFVPLSLHWPKEKTSVNTPSLMHYVTAVPRGTWPKRTRHHEFPLGHFLADAAVRRRQETHLAPSLPLPAAQQHLFRRPD